MPHRIIDVCIAPHRIMGSSKYLGDGNVLARAAELQKAGLILLGRHVTESTLGSAFHDAAKR